MDAFPYDQLAASFDADDYVLTQSSVFGRRSLAFRDGFKFHHVSPPDFGGQAFRVWRIITIWPAW